MNLATTGLKKPGVCRYFASTGTCFYGEECQFLHHHSQVPQINGVAASSAQPQPTLSTGPRLGDETEMTDEIGIALISGIWYYEKIIVE